MSKNKEQIGGDHYGQGKLPQHWDLTIMYGWDPFQYQIIKYLMRWKDKHDTFELRIDDLKKAKHFLEKYIEHAKVYDTQSNPDLGPGYALDIRDPDGYVSTLFQPAKDYEEKLPGCLDDEKLTPVTFVKGLKLIADDVDEKLQSYLDNGEPAKDYVDQD